MIPEMFYMAYMYGSTCTQQEEKFRHYKENGCTWEWEDCKAAFELLCEAKEYFKYLEMYIKEKKSNDHRLGHT